MVRDFHSLINFKIEVQSFWLGIGKWMEKDFKKESL